MKIKQGLEGKYAHYIKINTEEDKDDKVGDAYSKAILDCTEVFGNAVDEGKAFDEAEKIMLKSEDGLTGNMMGAIMSAMVHFHPQGDEIKKWWNKECGGTGEEKGTINPAIFTIK